MPGTSPTPRSAERDGVDDEFYLYEGAGHNALELRDSDARIIEFLHRLRD